MAFRESELIADNDHWWRPFRRIGHIDVFHIDLTPHTGHEEMALAWLDGPERMRWERFGSRSARRRFVLCRAALRAVLCDRASCPNGSLSLAPAKHGKPLARVEGKPLGPACNVSHSGNHGLIVVAPRGRVGVDVEVRAPRKNLEGLIERAFSPAEKAESNLVDEHNKQHLFLRYWTVKEALAKAYGEGLSVGFADLEVPDDMRHGARSGRCQFPQLSDITWNLEDLSTEEFAAAVAYEG